MAFCRHGLGTSHPPNPSLQRGACGLGIKQWILGNGGPSPAAEVPPGWWFSHQVLSNSFDPMDCSPPGPSVHGVFQARILQWVARPRDRTQVSRIHGRFFTKSPGKPKPGYKNRLLELASCVSPPMSCWSLSSEHTGSGRPDRLRKEGGAGKRQSRALRRWGSFWVPSAAVAALVAASTQSKLPGHGGQVWDVEMAREARRSLAFLRIQLPPRRAPPRLRGLTPPCVG